MVLKNDKRPCRLCGEPKCKPGREATCSACRQRRKRAKDREVAAKAARRNPPTIWAAEERAESAEWHQLGDQDRDWRFFRPRLVSDDVDPEVLAVWFEETAGRVFRGRRVLRGMAA